jgi:hypothetical protein
VHAVVVVALRGRVAVPLAGEAVHDDRPAERGGVAERVLQPGHVVSVDRPDVREPHRLEQVAISGSRAQCAEVGREAADGRRVGAAVVVEHDHDRQVR